MNSSRTLAAAITAPRRIELQDVDLPGLGPGLVLVQVAECGISETDLRVYRDEVEAQFPYVVGREFGGKVVALGPGVTGLAVGDRVAVWTPLAARPGSLGLATHAVVEAAHCARTRTPHPSMVAPLARCVLAGDVVDVPTCRHVVIAGGGYDAQLLTALLRSARTPTTLTVTVAAAHQHQLDTAVRMGATNVVLVDGHRADENARLVAASVREHTGGGVADVAFETTGAGPEGIEHLASILSDDGTLVCLGGGQDPQEAITAFSADPRGRGWSLGGRRLAFASDHDLRSFQEAARLLGEEGWAAVERLTTYRGLAHLEHAVADAADEPVGHFRTVIDLES